MDQKTVADYLLGRGVFAKTSSPIPFEGSGIEKTSNGMTNETGWMTNPTFKERWEGERQTEMPDLSTSEKLEAFLNPKPEEMNIQWLLRNKNNPPKGWAPNQFPKFSPTMDTIEEWTKHPNKPMEGSTAPVFPGTQDPIVTAPYNPDKPEVYNYPMGNQ